jgi:hypothetical protein
MKGEKMKKVLRFIEIEFVDFKSFRNKTIKFNEDETHIIGKNKEGKSTIAHGISWILTGKDTFGKAKFDLFPLDKDRNLIPGTIPMVRLVIELNGERIELKRVQGKDTKCYVNDAPMATRKFLSYISEIADEKLLMSLLIPTYFGNSLTWQEQKTIILDNFITEDTIIIQDEYELIRSDVETIGVDLTIDKYKSQLDLSTKNKDGLISQKELKEAELVGLDIDDKDDLISKRDDFTLELNLLEKQKDSVSPLETQLLEYDKRIFRLQNVIDVDIKSAREKTTRLENERLLKRKEYTSTTCDLKNIKDICEVCKSELDKDGIAHQRSSIQEKIDKIKSDGESLTKKIKTANLELSEKESITPDIVVVNERERVNSQIKVLKKDIDQNRIIQLRKEISELSTTIGGYDLINKSKETLKQIKSDLKIVTEKLDDIEEMQSLVKKYHQEFSELIASKINESLTSVYIRTFKIQKNGTPVETFEITCDGVPYTSVNTGDKTIAGMELIDLISKTLDIDCPVICDNFESITSNVSTERQLITLSAKKDVVLTVL